MVVQGCTWLYKVVQGCTWLYMVVQGFTWLYKIVHGSIWFTLMYKVVQGCTRLYLVVHDCTWLYIVVYGCTWLYMVVQSILIARAAGTDIVTISRISNFSKIHSRIMEIMAVHASILCVHAHICAHTKWPLNGS